jgi:FSR family fosmidomycin resistance protein-like MFS transporter
MILGLLTSAVLYNRLKNIPVRPPGTGPSLPWREALTKMRPVFLPLSGVIVLRAFVLSALIIFLPTFLSEKGASLWSAGAALTVYEAAGVGGALAGGWLSDRLGRRAVLIVSMLLTPLFLFFFLDAQGLGQILYLIGLGFTALSIAPVIMALVQESFPQNRAFATGIYMFISFGMRGVAVVIVGALGDIFDLQVAFIVSAVLMILGSPLVFLLPAGRPKTASGE